MSSINFVQGESGSAQALTPLATRLTLDAAEIAQLIGVGQRTFWRWVSSEVFPRPDLRIGKRIVKWRRETVLEWIDQRVAASRS